MGIPLTGPAVTRQSLAHFSMGRLISGLAAGLWLWSLVGALPVAALDYPAAFSCQPALDCFNHEDYSHALSLLKQSPASNGAREHADIFNLKGAIFLRQNRDDQARPASQFGGDTQPGQATATQMPPTVTGMNLSLVDETEAPERNASPVAKVLARHRSSSSHASPTPESPTASPADNENTSPSPLPSPDAAASPGSKTTDAEPVGTPSPAFIQKYEAAMVQFLQKDYQEAKKLLDEADAIQPRQPNSINLRNQIFKAYYEAAYTAYQHADYQAAATQLDGADGIGSNPQNQSDAYNLRGLVLSKQRNYPEAEAMFHKAVQTDPGLWAAKFNYAEVPFNYKNFTVARARFEELFSQTDPAKQPVEAELTQFKVFLTLLLEGKEDAARTFMQHFNFSGVTPARYFCQSALNFYSGDVDKAQGWIDSARKEYPARKSSSFLEAFYRVGWLVDPNAPPGSVPTSALAAASPAASPPAMPASVGPAPALAAVTPPPASAATPVPAASRPGTAAATFTPPVVAVATPPLTGAANSPVAVPAFRAVVTPPAGTPAASPVIAAASPAPTVAASKPAATVVPLPTAPKVAVAATPRPAPSVPVARPPAAQSSPAPAPAAAPTLVDQPASTGGDFLRVLIVGAVFVYFLYVVARIVFSAASRKPRRPAGRMPSLGNRGGEKPDPVELPR